MTASFVKHKSLRVTRHSGPEVLHVVENDLHPPVRGAVRICVVAAAAGAWSVLASRPAGAAQFPILEAAQANALLESGQVTRNVVLVST